MAPRKGKEPIRTHLLSEVISTWLKHVVGHLDDDPETFANTVRNYVKNARKEDSTDEFIFEEIGALNVLYGNPFDWYMGMYLKYDERAQARVQVAARAEKAVRKSAKVAQLAAEKEYNNKRLCVEYEREERLKQSSNSALTTPSAKTIRTHLDSPFGEILQGSYVEITADLSPGKCSYGGKGHVIEKLGAGPKATFRVKYDESFGRHTEHGIPYCRITLIPTTYQHYQRNKNARPK